jgi:hypothetical protein
MVSLPLLPPQATAAITAANSSSDHIQHQQELALNRKVPYIALLTTL